MKDKPYAYVFLKPCRCIDFACTREYAERHGIALASPLSAVTLDEYNRLKMKCDHCYRKDVK